DGQPRREVVDLALKALSAIWHRGAVDADGKSGDGAGILIGLPRAFFEAQVRDAGHEPRSGPIAVGVHGAPVPDGRQGLQRQIDHLATRLAVDGRDQTDTAGVALGSGIVGMGVDQFLPVGFVLRRIERHAAALLREDNQLSISAAAS
ncbi:MAG: hypothetical protein EON88_01340, partial [Brevundimonas sp.]